ncbi:cellulosome enzyme [Thozetella sp. PMI_491]|nr:cellulosome enzyme [Thozetella sp. PMI_491]
MVALVKVAVAAAIWTLGSAQITVKTGSTLQVIDGFGCSQAFKRAAQFRDTSETLRKQALELMFNATTGAAFSIIRNRVGSGGAGDSILPASPGSPTGTPKYSFDKDDEGQVWFSQQAMSYGVKTIYADAWSAPGFMKTSGSESKSGYLCGTTGHTCSSGDWRKAYADFLVQYIKYYADLGIPVTHIGFLNEPEFVASYSTMQIGNDAGEAISFIPTLHDAVQLAGLNVSVACCDAMGWNTQKSWTSRLVSAGMEQYLGIITSHAYASEPTSAIPGTKLPVWLTEAGPDSSGFKTTWYASGGASEGMTWANKLATGFLNANLSAYLFWEGYENKQQQSGSHLLDTDGTSVIPSGIFWAFTMWSRYIRPGAYRLVVSGSLPSIMTGAFKNVDGSLVVLFTNSGASARTADVTFDGLKLTTATAILTDNSHKAASTDATVTDGALSVSVPGHSVVTVRLT